MLPYFCDRTMGKTIFHVLALKIDGSFFSVHYQSDNTPPFFAATNFWLSSFFFLIQFIFNETFQQAQNHGKNCLLKIPMLRRVNHKRKARENSASGRTLKIPNTHCCNNSHNGK
jgi:hypothetical protein